MVPPLVAGLLPTQAAEIRRLVARSPRREPFVMGSADASAWVTRELSAETWDDFVDLFSRGNGWDHCACTYFQRGRGMPKGSGSGTRAARQVENLRQKSELVKDGLAHGILVYDDREPVGWCQFGPVAELPCGYPSPRRDEESPEPDWRITCFVTDKRYRGRGVAAAALKAAVDAIRRAGGGATEAYPVAGWTSGEGAVAPGERIDVGGVGHVDPALGTYGFVSTQGTVPMFAAQGFTAVGTVTRESRLKVSGRPPESHVVMRRTVGARPGG